MNKLAMTEDDLQAWVDGALPEARRGDVEEYLAAHPDETERLRAYQAQKQALKALFQPVFDEPLPERLQALATQPVAVDPKKRPIFERWSLQRIAAGLLVAVFSGAAGWLGHAQYQGADRQAQVMPLPRQAAVAHVVFSPDVRRPVEVSAAQEDQLVAWLSKRLGTPVRPPKLAAIGYELIGGRLLPGNSGPVAQFMYGTAGGQRLTLYVTREVPGQGDAQFKFGQDGPVNVFYWVEDHLGYAISAGADKAELMRVSQEVYRQLKHG